MNTDHDSNRNFKKRSSKAVVERKKLTRRVKYNAIGVARQQARAAAVNVIHVDDQDVDLSDVFLFMTWYLENVESIANNPEVPTPDSVVVEFRTNLIALDLSGINRREKVEFVMDVVRAPELHAVCTDLLKVDEAVDAVEEIPLIDLSDNNNVQDESVASIPDASNIVVSSVDPATNECVREDSAVDHVVGFVNQSLMAGAVPVLTMEEAYKKRCDYELISFYVANWTLTDFRQLHVDHGVYSRWVNEIMDDRSQITNVICCDGSETQHRFQRMYFRPGIPNSIKLSRLSEFRGFTGVSSGGYPHIGVITTGENRCELLWV